MDAATLRSIQAPLKERYRDDAAAARITLRARGALDDSGIACKVETCAGVTLRAVATALEIPVRSGTVSAEGDLDFRGTLAVARDAPVGFTAIRLAVVLDSDAPQEKLEQLLKLTERYCVVYQTIRGGVPVEVYLTKAA
jgi:hypothetical protein